MHFSSVFKREDTSSLPVPETKFEGSEGERLGQLVVTPEVVANKINNMKENKSQGVDGIAVADPGFSYGGGPLSCEVPCRRDSVGGGGSSRIFS